MYLLCHNLIVESRLLIVKLIIQIGIVNIDIFKTNKYMIIYEHKEILRRY